MKSFLGSVLQKQYGWQRTLLSDMHQVNTRTCKAYPCCMAWPCSTWSVFAEFINTITLAEQNIFTSDSRNEGKVKPEQVWSMWLRDKINKNFTRTEHQKIEEGKKQSLKMTAKVKKEINDVAYAQALWDLLTPLNPHTLLLASITIY